MYYHRAYCEECGTTYQLAHNWETVFGGGVECLDCGLVSDIGGIGSVMSLSDEELEAFIASLSEDQLARVTAMLPPQNDGELVTE